MSLSFARDLQWGWIWILNPCIDLDLTFLDPMVPLDLSPNFLIYIQPIFEYSTRGANENKKLYVMLVMDECLGVRKFYLYE